MQRASKTLRLVDGQEELPLVRRAEPQPVSDEVILSCKDFLATLNLCVNVSGLDEKEIYIALKIDPSHWSRMRKGESHFPLNKLNDLCDLCGNEIPLIWWAHSRGKGLVLLETESERQLKAEREARIKAEEKLAYLESLHTKAVR